MALNHFDVERKFKEFWKMSQDSIDDAASILIELLREAENRALHNPQESRVVTMRDIVKRKMGFTGPVPERWEKQFVVQLDAVNDEHSRIRAVVEATGEFILTVVDRVGRPAIRGAEPDGFISRLSEAGAADTKVQIDMTSAKIVAIARRQKSAGVIDEHQYNRAINGIGGVVKELLPAMPDLFATVNQNEIPPHKS